MAAISDHHWPGLTKYAFIHVEAAGRKGSTSPYAGHLRTEGLSDFRKPMPRIEHSAQLHFSRGKDRHEYFPVAWPWNQSGGAMMDAEEANESSRGEEYANITEQDEPRSSANSGATSADGGVQERTETGQTAQVPGGSSESEQGRGKSSRRPKMDFHMDTLLGRETDANVGDPREASRWLPSAPAVSRPRAIYNAAALAYLGDSIYELYARRHFLTPPQNVDKLSSRVTAVVCCEAQDWLLRRLLRSNFLTEEERDVVRWGRNVSTGSRKAKGRAGNAVYSGATSLETLVGYLYLTNAGRLDAVMSQLGFACDSSQIIPKPDSAEGT